MGAQASELSTKIALRMKRDKIKRGKENIKILNKNKGRKKTFTTRCIAHCTERRSPVQHLGEEYA
jgi:hypothetical protein